MCGGLSHPVPTSYADIPAHNTDPSPAPIKGLSELKWRRADLGQVPAIPWESGPTLTSPDERVPAILGCRAVANPSASDAVSVLPVLLHVTGDCALTLLPWPER